jgi:hypothetical protein
MTAVSLVKVLRIKKPHLEQLLRCLSPEQLQALGSFWQAVQGRRLRKLRELAGEAAKLRDSKAGLSSQTHRELKFLKSKMDEDLKMVSYWLMEKARNKKLFNQALDSLLQKRTKHQNNINRSEDSKRIRLALSSRLATSRTPDPLCSPQRSTLVEAAVARAGVDSLGRSQS